MEGEYKHLQGVDDKCIVCPENSNSTDVGALSCDCLAGYYRAEDEEVHTECTSECTIYLKLVLLLFPVLILYILKSTMM